MKSARILHRFYAMVFLGISLLAMAFNQPAKASLLTLTNLNSLGLPDTNTVKSVAADTNTPTLADGTVTTIGLPVRWQPDSNGVVQIFQTAGNYVIYGPTLGRGMLYRFPDSSSNATAVALSGFNTFQTPTVIIDSGISTNISNATGTNVNLSGSFTGTVNYPGTTNPAISSHIFGGGATVINLYTPDGFSLNQSNIDSEIGSVGATQFDPLGAATAATNGLVGASITNGLASTNYVLTAISVTNAASLTATTNLVTAATNGLVTAAVTNGLATTNYVTAATAGMVTNNLFNQVSFLDFCGTNLPNPPMLVQDNVNAHGWYDQSTNINLALQWCQTNTLGKNVLYFPKGIYRIASQRFLVPANVSITGNGVLHWGIQNYPDLISTNYSMLWFDSTNALGVEFTELGHETPSFISNIQIEGFTNPVAPWATIYAAPLSQYGYIGLQVYNGIGSWCGGFSADHVSTSGFRVGIANQAGESTFNLCSFILNGIGYASCANSGALNSVTNSPELNYFWTNFIEYIPGHGPFSENGFVGFTSADETRITQSGGGFRADGCVYWIDGPRTFEIDHDTSYCYHKFGIFGSTSTELRDCYNETWGACNDQSTNFISLVGGFLIMNNCDWSLTASPTNFQGDSMTNTALVDTTAAEGQWGLTINNSQWTSFGSAYGPSILARRSATSYRGAISLSKNSTGGMIQYISSNPALPHADYMAPGSLFCGDIYQINDVLDGAGLGFMYQITNILTKAANYGVITMQRSSPDYLSTVVRSNSIGNGVLQYPWEETQVAYDPTNSYWVRLLQSDISPIYYNTRNNSFEPPANYHMDNLVVNSNLTVSGNISGNGSGLTNAAGNPYIDAVTATNIASAATNGLVGSSITNGLASTNYVLTAISVTNAANLTAITNLVTAATNGLATTNYVNAATNGLVASNSPLALTLTNAANVFGGTFNSVTNTIVLGYGRINGTYVQLPGTYYNIYGYQFQTNVTGVRATHYILPDELQGRTNIQIICTYVATNSGTGFFPWFNLSGTGPTSATSFNVISYHPTLSYVNGFNYITNTYNISPSYTNMYLVNLIGVDIAPTNGIWVINVKEILW